MKTLCTMWMTTAAVAALVGCSDAATDDSPTTAAAVTSGTGPSGPGGTMAGTGGSGTSSGPGGAGGSAPSACSADPKPLETIDMNIGANRTLTADKDYLIKGIVQVRAGAVLTIEPCTKVMGEAVSLGTLVIEPGAKLMAEGAKDKPIVFTSEGEPGDRAPGDWGGLIVLGKAPINQPGGKANVEGILGDGTQYGGSDPNDNSGVIKYVRIEFSGVELSPNNEINGLTMAGVGSGTTIDYVMVHETLDDCFEFFGGTVSAKHFICAQNGDDGFDWDNGFSGKLQFLALQQDPTVADDTNGFEADNDADGSANMPISEPTIYNATLCGKNKDVDKQQFGMLLRRSTRGHLFDIIATGFEAGVDLRDPLTNVELGSSIFFGNVVKNVAYAEDGSNESTEANDDNGVDEVAWFNGAGTNNSEGNPKIADCFAAKPNFLPASTLTDKAKAPPDDGFFDASAAYIGAFAAGDDWATGAWISYDPN